nr:tail fiber domain-containing protein [Microcystis aeruginosa L311-01]
FRVLGSNAILNDGTTQNTLKLKVLNSPLSNNTRPILLLNQSSKFIVSFEQGDHPDALVAIPSQLNGVQITVTDTNSWTSTHTVNSTEWSFTPKINQLTAGQGIELTISNLVTNSASGLACIYIDYQNIGSYPDGRLVIPIEKTPLLYSGGQVGIGITNPVAKLDIQSAARTYINNHPTAVNGLYVTGAFKADKEGVEFRHSDGKQGIGFGFNTIYATGNDGNQDLGLTAKGKGKVKVHSPLWVEGNVGIGITNPVAKLDIQSENRKNQHPTAVNGLYVTGAFKADQEGVEFRHSDGKQGIGFGYNTIYATGNDDNQNLGLKAKGKGKVKVDSPLWVEGNVGIGTNDPKAKLHVNGGDAVISGNVGIGTTSPAAKLHVDGGDAVISGKVGIGTTSPAAKLHVDGSVKFGGNSTIINQMICGQVFYDTTRKHWGYRGFAKGAKVVLTKIIPSSPYLCFCIYYGFTVERRQDLVILATVLDRSSVVFVSDIRADYCEILICDSVKHMAKRKNFSVMIIHYACWEGADSFYPIENGNISEEYPPIMNYTV